MEHEFNNYYNREEEGVPFPETRSTRSLHYSYMFKRQMFYIWMFMIREDIWEEACEFLEEHMDDPSPFEMFPFELWSHVG